MHRAAIGLLLVVIGTLAGCGRYTKVANFDLGDGIICEITKAKDWEVHIPYYYRITHASGILVPATMVDASTPETPSPEYEMIHSDDHQTFGLVTRAAPNDVLMLFDKKTNGSWPHAGDTELSAAVQQRGEQLLAQLVVGSNNHTLRLNRR